MLGNSKKNTTAMSSTKNVTKSSNVNSTDIHKKHEQNVGATFMVYKLKLDAQGKHNENDKLIRLPPPNKPFGLRLTVPKGSPASSEGTILYINYPINKSEFARETFHKLKLSNTDSDGSFFDVLIEKSGVFQYYVSYTDATGSVIDSSKGYIIVDPCLQLKNNPLPLDGVNLLTVVAKWLGPISEWDQHFQIISELGYNLIHFVPLQARGGSNSPYSIKDQLELSKDLFKPNTSVKDQEIQLSGALQGLRQKGLLSLIDLVWNHTSFDSEWLMDHPESGYNLTNSPHLRPAYELDTALLELSTTITTKYYLNPTLENEEDLANVMSVVKNDLVPNLKLYEYYAIDVKRAVKELRDCAESRSIDEDALPLIPTNDIRNLDNHQLGLRLASVAVKENPGVRFGKSLLLEVVIPVLRIRLGFRSVYDNLEEACTVYHDLVNMVNFPFYQMYDDDVAALVNNINGHLRYQRLDPTGPKYKEIGPNSPLLQPYFTRLPENDRTKNHAKESLALANNGWVWAADPKLDFAQPESRAYLRRDVIVWGDCVKLRYGQSRDDSPWLWDHMAKYTVDMAKLFDGFRIDNCHSTPIHLAEYLLDQARLVNPNLYVVAELFTGSEEADKHYVCRLGINSLIREAMQASDPFELSRLVHRYGGVPVGSLDDEWQSTASTFNQGSIISSCLVKPVQGQVTHSLFMDCTHDNESPSHKRTSIDALPNAMIVGMTQCAVGSVKGYDEAYPQLLNLVQESRKYNPVLDSTVGLGKAKKQILNLHLELAQKGYKEVHVHHENNYVMVHRQHPKSHDGYLLIAHTAFKNHPDSNYLSPVKLRGTLVDFLGCYRLKVNGETKEDDQFIKGIDVQLEEVDFPLAEQGQDDQGTFTELKITDEFTPGTVLLLKTRLEEVDLSLTKQIGKGAEEAVAELEVKELNLVLYRCDAEERDVLGSEAGAYEIPSVTKLAYCGLQGFITVLKPVMKANDLGHPICNHLRQGQWALQYTIDRLKKHLPIAPRLKALVEWFEAQSKLLSKVPPFLFPKYFSMLMFGAYKAATHKVLDPMTPFIKEGDWFVKATALCYAQVGGQVKSTSLHPTEPSPCLAAGLPHFAVEHMRTWGRDTFIALRGLLLFTGQFNQARNHLVAFAGAVKHGLVPNLLDSLRFPRYNARDATWWFLQAVQDYCRLAPEGLDFLQAKIPMRFPDGDTFVKYDDPLSYSTSKPLSEVIQDILQRHAKGIQFREWNAGPSLDNHMSDEGFNVSIKFNKDTGFLSGGNLKNCGTWMDKMGESTKAGTMGKPATPRDGAPVEITGLLKSTVRWLTELSQSNKFNYKGVKLDDNSELSYQQWDSLIQTNFEKYYYVPSSADQDGQYNVVSHLINRRGIYKDTVGSQLEFSDYQLRPNFPVAMHVAPELFDLNHARQALELVDQVLVAPKGMKTLDPVDLAYRGSYDNSNDSNDPAIAKGFNYHQGPEWGWPLGYFLLAKLHFGFDTLDNESKKTQVAKLNHYIHSKLTGYKESIRTDPFVGLPELTNQNGAFCPDSCPTQAWSAATALEVLFKLYNVSKEFSLVEKVEGQKDSKVPTKAETSSDKPNSGTKSNGSKPPKPSPKSSQDSHTTKQGPTRTKSTSNTTSKKASIKPLSPTEKKAPSSIEKKLTSPTEKKAPTSTEAKTACPASPSLTNKIIKKSGPSSAPVQTQPALGKTGSRSGKIPPPLISPSKGAKVSSPIASPTSRQSASRENSRDGSHSPLQATFSSMNKSKSKVV